jgi:uncharacterized protein involved in outer membrane biogenesis
LGRFLAILATLLIAVLGAAFAVPAFIDWNYYRPVIEKTASGLLGRRVSILGDIDIALLPELHLRANNVAAGNGVKDGVLLTADSVDLVLSLPSLLGGRIEAGKARLVRPVLTVDFARPLSSPDPEADAGALPFGAGIESIEIDRGRLAVFSRDNGMNEALSLTKVSGTLSAASAGNPYRFTGRAFRNDRPYDLKFSAAPGLHSGIKLAGTISDPASKTALQADGVFIAAQDPSFEGSATLNVPQQGSGASRVPVDVQVKAAAKLGLSGAVLDDLTLTLDAQNRPQILLGSASSDFGAKTANINLQGRSLDADGLLSASAGTGIPMASSAPADWDGLKTAVDRLLWLYPGYGLSLTLEPGQVQLKGELIEDVKIHGTRTAERWVFDRMQATLPGETTIRLAGTVKDSRDGPQISATAAADGKYLSRLGRWIAPAAFGSSRLPAGAFALKGSLTLSDEASAFEGVTGSLNGTAFTGSLRYDKAPIRKLSVSLNGDNFDLSPFETGAGEMTGLAADPLKYPPQTGLQQIASLLDASSGGFESIDATISAGSIKTSAAEVRNVAVQFKASPGAITVSKLSAETASGLTLRGQGVVPLQNTGQGQFDGRIEARSPQAILQIVALAGYGPDGPAGLRANALAPAALSIGYSAGPLAGAAVQLSGNLGPAHAEGRAQLTGSLNDWKTGSLSAQMNLSAPDGNKLLGLVFPTAVIAPGPSIAPGTLAIRLGGTPSQMQTTAALASGPLQIQLDGAAGLNGQSLTFKGKANASSQTPEQFLPPSLLALLAGEPRANLKIGANVSVDRGHVSAEDLSAETPKNLVTGRLAIDMSDQITRVNADLKADQYSFPSLLSFFLSESPGETAALVLPASPGAPLPPADVWSGRPFSLNAFQNTAGGISLTAKAMKLSDAITLSDAQFHAKLQRGRLDIEALKGRALGGDFETSFSLATQGNTVSGEGEISLSGIDLGTLPGNGTPPVIAGQASIALSAAGQGLSPRGLIALLRGRGSISLSDGQLSKLSPSGVQKSAEDLLAGQLPLTEEAITKRVLEAAQTGDFAFHRLKIPVAIEDGILEIRRASFRGRDATVRMQAYLDLNKMQVDSTWQMGVSSDRRLRWPPVRIVLSGPLRELGARPRTLAAEDFVRAVLVRKMEGDLNRLEGLNKPSASSQWTVTQEPASKEERRRKRGKDNAGNRSIDPAAAAKAPAPPPAAQSFEKRMRDALENAGNGSAPR